MLMKTVMVRIEQIYVPALESGRFRLESVTGSLRVLRRVD